ncbi:MAG: type II toxin-antitoxin system RatA family toxin [Candidatus Baltobacteraceae bacterium]
MRNEIVIEAPGRRIYDLASATEHWPQMLPHYRFVRVLSEAGHTRVVEMAARRGMIPVRWRAEQVNDPEIPQITFRHVRGWTRGMLVWWRFDPHPRGTRVTIEHELRSPLAPVIGRWFIDPIATRTLRCVKALAEAQP